MSPAGAGGRRIPWSRAWPYHVMAILFVPGQVGATLTTNDRLYHGLGVCSSLGAVLAYASFLRWTAPARQVGRLSGTPLPVVLRAEPGPAYAFVAAGVLGVVAAAFAVVLELRDPTTADPKTLLVALIPVYALPTLVRLAAGRLRLWSLRVDADGLHYRGGRHERVLRWSEVRDLRHDQRHQRLRVDAGSRKQGFDMPLLVFDHPPAEIVDVLTAACGGRGSR